MSKSKTAQAIEYMKANPEVTVYAAAKQFAISPSAVYRAIKNLEETANDRCPTCGQLIKGNH